MQFSMYIIAQWFGLKQDFLQLWNYHGSALLCMIHVKSMLVKNDFLKHGFWLAGGCVASQSSQRSRSLWRHCDVYWVVCAEHVIWIILHNIYTALLPLVGLKSEGQTMFEGNQKIDDQLGPLLLTCISNYIHCKVWDDITYPFPHFNGAAVEVCEWIIK